MKNRYAAVIGYLAIFLSTAANAALSGAITLAGTVGAFTGIVVTPLSGFNGLNLYVNTTDKTVASVKEINNTAAGYTVTMASANSGKLVNGVLGFVNYTAKYDGVGVSLSSTPQVVTSQGSQLAAFTAIKSLTISYNGTPQQNLMAGIYRDTITLVIAAN